jgi:hypothetical protein
MDNLRNLEDLQPANDNGTTEFSAISKAIDSKLESGEVDSVLNKFREWSQHPDSIEMGVSAVSSLDNWKYMRKFREFWNNRSEEVQYCIMKSTSVIAAGPMAPTALMFNMGPIQSLIKMGVITYKGHIGEDGKIMEDKITSMGGMEKVMLNGGLKVASGVAKIGKYIYPELEIVEIAEKLVDPVKNLLGTSNKFLEKVRAGVYENRAAFESAETRRNSIIDETRLGCAEVMQSLPANDNTVAAPASALAA